jgi:hypothetical protein
MFDLLRYFEEFLRSATDMKSIVGKSKKRFLIFFLHQSTTKVAPGMRLDAFSSKMAQLLQ